MKAFDIMEALTEVDDAALLRAEQDPPRHRSAFSGFLRYATAACLTVALILLAVVPARTEAGDTSLKWRIVIDEEGIRYIFENRPYPTDPVPHYDITWLPEDYVLFRDFSKEDERSICYHSIHDDSMSYWLQCSYVGLLTEHHYSFTPEEYTMETVTIQGISGHHYRLTQYDMGYLVWIDREKQLLFSLSYGGDLSTALKVAESITITEGEGT